MYSYTDYNEKNISIQEVLSLALKFVANVCHDQSKSVQVIETGPAPRSGTETEVGVTFQCLRQWMSEMEAEMSGQRSCVCFCAKCIMCIIVHLFHVDI